MHVHVVIGRIAASAVEVIVGHRYPFVALERAGELPSIEEIPNRVETSLVWESKDSLNPPVFKIGKAVAEQALGVPWMLHAMIHEHHPRRPSEGHEHGPYGEAYGSADAGTIRQLDCLEQTVRGNDKTRDKDRIDV